jgi:hypothetical protein
MAFSSLAAIKRCLRCIGEIRQFEKQNRQVMKMNGLEKSISLG